MNNDDNLGWSTTAEGNVTITMTPADYQRLLMYLGYASASTIWDRRTVLALVNRLNRGNPCWTAYRLPESAAAEG